MAVASLLLGVALFQAAGRQGQGRDVSVPPRPTLRFGNPILFSVWRAGHAMALTHLPPPAQGVYYVPSTGLDFPLAFVSFHDANSTVGGLPYRHARIRLGTIRPRPTAELLVGVRVTVAGLVMLTACQRCVRRRFRWLR